LEKGEELAVRNNVYERLQPIFEYVPGNESPPPAPRHTSKPKQPKRPAVPKWSSAYCHLSDDFVSDLLQVVHRMTMIMVTLA
jgi:hypothetical protein